MRIVFQFIVFALIGLSAFLAGVMNFYSPDDVLMQYYSVSLDGLDPGLRFGLESQVRLLAGLWIVAGLAIFICIRDIEKQAAVFRLVAAGLVVSGIGELVTVITVDGPVFNAVAKVIFQTLLCGGLEWWRIHLARKLDQAPEIENQENTNTPA